MRVAITGFGASWNRGAHVLTPDSSLRAVFQRADTPSSSDSTVEAIRHQLIQNAFVEPVNSNRVALVYGSSKGDLEHLENLNSTDWIAWPNRFALEIARDLRVGGAVLAPVAACATGAHAIALGALQIQTGRADIVIAGASEPPQPELVLAAYRNLGALSKLGQMRPFDAHRDGFLPSNGDGFLVLESETNARKRGAKIHGFLAGTSILCDATSMTSMQPGGQTIARAIHDALFKAGHPKIDYINAHGTATQLGDLIEGRAIHSVFGDKVPVSSTKSLTGHLMGASGAVEAVICLLSMQQDFAPPNLGLEEIDAEMKLDFVMGAEREVKIDSVLSLSYGFGGHIGALILVKD
ncbi:MAG TPA: beta-ketoacyl-[acyl-carrier-protein] synthase family protein [Abditibacterium sp.]|jgi:3-oxoacyl-[acyl-carrier-protein] synthase II